MNEKKSRPAAGNGPARVPDCGEIAVFHVRLRCEAAPKIGCGLRAKPALAVFRKHRISVQALRGARFTKALNEFTSRSGWHRGADVDRLSNEEARIIAARLVTRLRTRASLPELGTSALEIALAEACAHELIRNPTQSAAARRRRLASAALAAARERFDAPAYAAFADAVRLGHRPLPDER